jgi:hypothetical protein
MQSAFLEAVNIADECKLRNFSSKKGNMTQMCKGAVEWLLEKNVTSLRMHEPELKLACRLKSGIFATELVKRPKAISALVSIADDHLAMQAINRMAGRKSEFAEACVSYDIAKAISKPPLHDNVSLYESSIAVFMNKLSNTSKKQFSRGIASTEDGTNLLLGMATKGYLVAYEVLKTAGKHDTQTFAGANRLLKCSSGLEAASKAARDGCLDLLWFVGHASEIMRVRLYVKMSETDWSYGEHGASASFDSLAVSECSDWSRKQGQAIMQMFTLYKKHVMMPLVETFKRSHPKIEVLCQVANAIGACGDSESILSDLSTHAVRARNFIEQQNYQLVEKSKKVDNEFKRKKASMAKAVCILTAQKVRLKRGMERMINCSKKSADIPAPLNLHEFLGRRVRRRTGCARCEVATGSDSEPRLGYLRDGVGTRACCASRKRACPFADHAIFCERDIMPLVREYDDLYNVTHVHKRRIALNFMKDHFGVEPLGGGGNKKRVTLYEFTHVNTSLSIGGGHVFLELRPTCRSYSNGKQNRDVFAGFQICAP